MKLGYYQIFWAKYNINTFEYRYDVEMKTLLKNKVVEHYTLIHYVNQLN